MNQYLNVYLLILKHNPEVSEKPEANLSLTTGHEKPGFNFNLTSTSRCVV